MRSFERRVIVITSGLIVKTCDTMDEAVSWIQEKGLTDFELLPVALPKEYQTIKIVKPKVIIPSLELGRYLLPNIARYAHICYAVEDSPRSDLELVKGLIRSGHESVLEHEKITVIWECDRGVSHEIVRHRIASFTQESTRYVAYDDIPVIEPFGLNDEEFGAWKVGVEDSEGAYERMRVMGVRPQIARGVLCNSLRTRIVITANIREWRHIFKLRCARDAHPQMQQMTIPTLLTFTQAYPEFFEDVPRNAAFDPLNYAEVVRE